MKDFRKEICHIAHRLWSMGMMPGADGNISVRDGENFLVSPSGVSKGFLNEKQILLVDKYGNVLDGVGMPSGELPLHLAAYSIRVDINAVVHTHGPHITAFACAGKVPPIIISEVIFKIGEVAVAPFAPPSTVESANVCAPFMAKHNVILLQNHGVVCLGETLEQAYLRAELIEHWAKVAILSRILGDTIEIPQDIVSMLKK